MKSLKILALISMSLLASPLMAGNLEIEDVTLLEDMTLYSSVNESDFKYKEKMEQNYDSQRYSNILKLNSQLKTNPEMSNLILPIISYLEKNEDIEDANKGLASLLVELSTQTK